MKIEQWMFWFVSEIPTMYIIVSSVFVFWGMFVMLCLWKIMNLAEDEVHPEFHSKHLFSSSNLAVRHCDKIHLLLTSLVLMFNIVGMIIVPLFPAFVDILFVSNVWIFVYYSYITVTSLKQLPRIWKSNHLRSEHERSPDEPPAIR